MQKIIIANFGWIFKGEYRQEGDYHILSNYAVVRKWTGGHGITGVADGTDTTVVLDPGKMGECKIHVLTTVAVLDAV